MCDIGYIAIGEYYWRVDEGLRESVFFEDGVSDWDSDVEDGACTA